MGGKGKAEGARCRRHPRQHHRQQGAGVCASCLRERLSHLTSLSAAASLPSVVRRDDAYDVEKSEYYYEDEEGGSSCSEASTAYSPEGSSAASSGRASPGDEPAFHGEMRRAARVSLLMRNERVVGDADAVAALLRARRERRRRTTSFWAKLLRAATRGGGAGRKEEGCSLAAARPRTIEERGAAAAAKWVLF